MAAHDSAVDGRLAAYGTLQPGRPNEHELVRLRGRWVPGRVHGQLLPDGWGATLGYPALRLDPAGPSVPVQVFLSEDLPDHWARLDAFEGDGYDRVVVEVETDEGPLPAWIYVLAGAEHLHGRTALVTGAGRGIGQAIARQLGAAGVTVVVTARSSAQLAETVERLHADGVTAVALTADLADPGRWEELAAAAVAALGRVDILINNAATVEPLGATVGLDPDVVAAAYQLNVLAPIALTARLLPSMLTARWGRIVNVSSGIAAHPTSMIGGNTYAGTKAALEAHTRNLAAELDGTGVTVNAYRPGLVDTAMQGTVRAQPPSGTTQVMVERFRRSHASGQLLTPEESAAALVARLGSRDTGAIWTVSDP